MSNMSYCRFENTKKDLDDCIEALEQRNIKSKIERRKAQQLLENILDFCEDEGIIEEYDSEMIERIIKQTEKENELE
jgi:intergrase/recombinase